MTGSDIFVGLPTGLEKSLIFQAIPVCYDFIIRKQKDEASSSTSTGLAIGDSLTENVIGIVISPLVPLCKNQVQLLSKVSVKAVYLTLDGKMW